ncbi:rod shape-determining protein MreD [Phascolarctobacterium sp.]|uniref:rod shape-determining protein MreD n=1 Tax=Phascolarctobacterium sp. TaxID=2049039 RepID=UPI003869F72C
MRRLIWPVLFLLLLLLQGAVSVFYQGWLSFDLLLIALYAFAMLRGQEAGAAVGAAIGLLQDAMTVGVFGYHILTRATLGYMIGFTKEKVVKDNAFYHMTAVGICSFLVRFCYWWLELVRSGGRWGIFLEYFKDSLGFILGNMLLTVPVVLAVKYVYEWIRKEDISY